MECLFPLTVSPLRLASKSPKEDWRLKSESRKFGKLFKPQCVCGSPLSQFSGSIECTAIVFVTVSSMPVIFTFFPAF